MRFFYWFKQFIKSFLYSMPKGFLVFLVIFLLLLLFNPSSKASSEKGVVFYDYIDIANSTRVDLGYNLKDKNFYLTANIDFTSWNTIFDCGSMYLQSNSQSWQSGGNGNVGLTYGINNVMVTRNIIVHNTTTTEYFFAPSGENAILIDNVQVAKYPRF